MIRLLGLFIWGIDLDNKNHDALNAVLQPAGIGKFRQQNGLGSNMGLSTYVGAIGDSCIIEGKTFDTPIFSGCLFVTDCGAPGVCKDGFVQVGISPDQLTWTKMTTLSYRSCDEIKLADCTSNRWDLHWIVWEFQGPNHSVVPYLSLLMPIYAHGILVRSGTPIAV
jgi:hypothetical protein